MPTSVTLNRDVGIEGETSRTAKADDGGEWYATTLRKVILLECVIRRLHVTSPMSIVYVRDTRERDRSAIYRAPATELNGRAVMNNI